MIKTLLRNIFQVTRDSGEHPISGYVTAPAVLGLMMVRQANTSASSVEPQGVNRISPEYTLVPADFSSSTPARRPYALMRDVLSEVDYNAWIDRRRRLLPDELANEIGEIAPMKVGAAVAAELPAEITVEGSAHLHPSVTGLLVGGTELTLVAGRWALRSAVPNSALAGRISGNVAPIVAANTRRYIIEVCL